VATCHGESIRVNVIVIVTAHLHTSTIFSTIRNNPSRRRRGEIHYFIKPYLQTKASFVGCLLTLTLPMVML
jgi:hypothetical protein